MALSACENPTSTNEDPSFARGGKPGTQSASTGIALNPTSVQMAVGGDTWLKVTVYDRQGNVAPEDNGQLLWFGCTNAVVDGPPCNGALDVIPIYPNLRDVHLIARASGTFLVSVTDGLGHRAITTVTIQ
jgi:hypothetical protein